MADGAITEKGGVPTVPVTSMARQAHDRTVTCAFEIAVVAFVTARFIVFVAHYAHLGAEITGAGHAHRSATPWRLAASEPDGTGAAKAPEGGFVASPASFGAGMFVLAVAANLHGRAWHCLRVVRVTVRRGENQSGSSVPHGLVARSSGGAVLVLCGARRRSSVRVEVFTAQARHAGSRDR